MKNKIIFYSISFLLALCIKPVVGFMTEARDCKFELENFKKAELNNKKILNMAVCKYRGNNPFFLCN